MRIWKDLGGNQEVLQVLYSIRKARIIAKYQLA